MQNIEIYYLCRAILEALAYNYSIMTNINPKNKTALGAEDSVRWQHFPDTLDAVASLRREGYVILAVEQVENSHKLGTYRFEPGKKYALILGNEVKGVQQCVVDACDGALEIPQHGTKHSLNVSVTAGIVMWEAARALLPSLH